MKKNLYITPALYIRKITISSILETSPSSSLTDDDPITKPGGMNAKESFSDDDSWDDME